MHKIAMIGTYFGCWPKWFPALCLSCKMNDSMDWLIFSDCEVPQESFSNIKFISLDLKQFNIASTCICPGFISKYEAPSLILNSLFSIVVILYLYRSYFDQPYPGIS